MTEEVAQIRWTGGRPHGGWTWLGGIVATLLIPFCGLVGDEADQAAELDEVATLLEFVLEVDEETAVECLDKIVQRALTGELKEPQLRALQERLSQQLKPIWSSDKVGPLAVASLQLAVLWGDEAAAARAAQLLTDSARSETERAAVLNALAARGDPRVLPAISQLLADPLPPPPLQLAAISALGRFSTPEVAEMVVAAYARLPTTTQAQAITLLTQRPAWSRRLIRAVQEQQIPATAVGFSHLRSLLASRDAELVALVKKQWGAVRTERNPQREQVIDRMRQFLSTAQGNAVHGEAIFQRVCGQCHKIHGTGQEVGPDITSNGRSSFDQLLSNVFDPSLVIGPAYQAVTVITVDGRIVTGLLAEDSDQRVALKTQGGKIETIPRSDVDEVAPSALSLMPENLEQQLQPQELADLFAFLTLDKPPRDPAAQPIAGSPAFTGGSR